eukprot:COSAG02_NODE_4066_length_5837_cov_4.346114_2_plen_396_part_00
MGCATSKDRVEQTSTVEADSFVMATDMEKLQLQQALDKGSFLFAQERSASAELAAQAPDSRPTLDADSAGADAAPIGTATCTADYDSGEDIDLQLKQVRSRPPPHCLCIPPGRRCNPPETQANDLIPAQGDVVVIIERVDKDWLRGYTEGEPSVIGFFPANFVTESTADADADKSGAAGDDEEEGVAHERRTLWVGSIPENQAAQEALTEVFAKFGKLDNITVRRKATEDHGPNKSWCFVSYKTVEGKKQAVGEKIFITDETGANVQLRVREPNLVAELSKPTTGALGGIWENHKSLLGAAMKVDLQQNGDGITAGMTMNKVEKALDLVPTGHKAEKNGSADWEDLAGEGSFETAKEAKVSSASFRKIKQMSKDFEASRSQDMEDTEKPEAAIDG